MMTVELIYDKDCPNVAETRAELMRAFSKAGIAAHWVEWDRGDPASPPYVRNYGSPTVLVDGKDVAGATPTESISCCRLYRGTDGGFRGAPTSAMIAEALKSVTRKTADKRSESGWRSSLAALPGIGASLLPVGVCPACWPVYAGILSSLGLGFLLKEGYLLPLTAAFLLVAVGGLAYKAGARRGYGPFVLGLVASGAVLAGKFVLEVFPIVYGGVALLLGASIWNAWPRKTAGTGGGTCPACAPGGQEPLVDKPGATHE
jgi:hypothetical protein